MHKIRFVAQKEFYHILRDFRSLMIVFLMPVLMTFLYGYAINMDIENVTVAVKDFDQSASSRELVDRFRASPYFDLSATPVDMHDPQKLLRSSEATAIIYIPNGFARALARGEQFELGMTVDGSDASLAAAVQGFANAVLGELMRARLPEGFEVPGVTLSYRVLYNPDLKSAHFFVPGLVAVILMMISALLTSMTIAREKETGTMEQLLTAPVKPYQILIGKLVPYIIIAFTDGILVLLFARLIFGVPFVGSHLLLLGFGFIYVATALSMGILISSVAKTQQVAMMLAQVATLLPSVMLSGFIFAIKNMPLPLQAISYIIPARYFVKVIRGIMLKGAGADLLALQGLALVILMVILLATAVRKFRTQVA